MGRLGRRARALAAVCAAGWLAACASGSGATHVLRPGENLYRLSRYYRVPVRAIERANGIDDVTRVPVGAALWIPGTERPPPGHSLAPVSAPRPAPAGDLRALARREAALALAWPVSGAVSSSYGWRGGRQHEGIDIAAPRGAPIRAAEAGRVIHAGRLGDYGRVVIVKHAGHYQTIYAHNRANHVRKGEFVERGQLIGEVGASGNARGPHLHFEVRRQRRPLDPLDYLP